MICSPKTGTTYPLETGVGAYGSKPAGGYDVNPYSGGNMGPPVSLCHIRREPLLTTCRVVPRPLIPVERRLLLGSARLQTPML